ncbi:MAG: ABC transporter ATP-binding protein/permease, partial [Clostridia bacterium]|nr:ABC transporter ATP-binding protein/permease [Clostridia bacterium]
VGYFLQLIQNIAWFFGTIVKFKTNVPFANDFLSFFDIKSEMKMGSLPVEKRSDRRFEISLDHVTFRYPDSNKEALRDVSLKIRTGERLAVVGMNGSGKTTLIKLLCRLYDPTGGKIVMNDFDIKNYDYDEYQGLFSLTFQDFHLFPFTIGQNVAAGKAYQPERCEEILRSVDFGKRLDELPAGLETHLYKDFDSDGVEISGGEGQKIALARAVYHDTPFIILDEPTAALDPSSEAKIYKSFDQITGGKTTIYISHRLSSCRFCDRIAVLDEGKLVQLGTHEELLADTEGKYAELWNAQAQYYKE